MEKMVLVLDPRFREIAKKLDITVAVALPSRNRSNIIVIKALLALIVSVIVKRPDVVLFLGVVTNTPFLLDVPKTFAVLRKIGLLRKPKVIIWANKTFERTERRIVGRIQAGDLRVIDRVIIYNRDAISHLPISYRKKFVYIPLPAVNIPPIPRSQFSKPYAFAGGESQRDFESLIAAVDSTGIDIRIHTLGKGVEILESS